MVKKSNTDNSIPVKKMLANQDAFLAAYTLVGSVKKACESIGITREAVSSWNRNDIKGFRERYISAQEDFREGLQDMAVERVKMQKPSDNPVLLITLLNAHWPEKYRRTGYAVESAGKDMIDAWKKWEKENKKTKGKEQVEQRDNAVEEAERILARKSNSDTDGTNV